MAEEKTVGVAGSRDGAMAILVELLDREICKPTENLTIQKRRRRRRDDFHVVALTPFPNEQPAFSDGSRYWLAMNERRRSVNR